MSEEEAIKICKNIIRNINGETCFLGYSKEQDKEAIETLLKLYHKQKEEMKELNLENQAFYEEMNCNDNKYISKKYSQLKSVVGTLANGIRVLGTNPDITTEEIIKEFTEKPITEEYMKKFDNSYISKDEVLKALGYEENDEEYKRIYNKEELILSLIRTINEECDRLEDIEDQKVEVAVTFIEEKRDKYWQDKIKDILKKYEKRPLEEGICFYKEIEKLLEEQL